MIGKSLTFYFLEHSLSGLVSYIIVFLSSASCNAVDVTLLTVTASHAFSQVFSVLDIHEC